MELVIFNTMLSNFVHENFSLEEEVKQELLLLNKKLIITKINIFLENKLYN